MIVAFSDNLSTIYFSNIGQVLSLRLTDPTDILSGFHTNANISDQKQGMSRTRLCIERGPGQKISYIQLILLMGLSPIKFPKIIFIGNLLNASTVTNTKLLTNSSKSTVKTNHSYSFFGLSFVGHLAQLYILMNVMVQYLFKIQVSRRMILCDSCI